MALIEWRSGPELRLAERYGWWFMTTDDLRPVSRGLSPASISMA
jgi:hypothetical protein